MLIRGVKAISGGATSPFYLARCLSVPVGVACDPGRDHSERGQQRQPERGIEQRSEYENLMASSATLATPGAHPCTTSQPCAFRSRRTKPRHMRPSVRPVRSAKLVCAEGFMVATSWPSYGFSLGIRSEGSSIESIVDFSKIV